MFKKVTLEPYKQLGDQYQPMSLEKSVSKMGLRSLRCWTNDHFFKKHWNFDEIFDFRGCGFFKFSNISIVGLLTNVSYTVFFCQDFHCGNEELFRRGKWWFMTKLHFYKHFGVFLFFWFKNSKNIIFIENYFKFWSAISFLNCF